MAWKTVHRFLEDTSGAALAYVGLTMFMMVGFAGLAVDAGYWYSTQRAAQAAADSAAVAGAYEAMWGGDSAAVAQAAKDQAAKNGFDPATVTVNYPFVHSNGAESIDAVEVIVQQPSQGFFSSLFLAGDDAVDIGARSVSGAVAGSPICFMTLDPTASKSIGLSSSSSVEANGCMVHVNSSASDAISTSGSATVTAEAVSVVGDVSDPTAITPAPDTGAPSLADPMAYLTPPSAAAGACDYNNFKGSDVTVDPGVYCGGIELSGDVTFNPGIYVIKDGKFRVSGGNMQGTGVAFYLTGADAFVSYSGGPTVHFTAPTSGEMAGLLFYQGPDAPADETSKFTGGGDSWYEGTLYFPDQAIETTGGNSATIPPHTSIIAETITITGGGTLTIGSDYGSSSVPAMPSLGGNSIAVLE